MPNDRQQIECIRRLALVQLVELRQPEADVQDRRPNRFVGKLHPIARSDRRLVRHEADRIGAVRGSLTGIHLTSAGKRGQAPSRNPQRHCKTADWLGASPLFHPRIHVMATAFDPQSDFSQVADGARTGDAAPCRWLRFDRIGERAAAKRHHAGSGRQRRKIHDERCPLAFGGRRIDGPAAIGRPNHRRNRRSLDDSRNAACDLRFALEMHGQKSRPRRRLEHLYHDSSRSRHEGPERSGRTDVRSVRFRGASENPRAFRDVAASNMAVNRASSKQKSTSRSKS